MANTPRSRTDDRRCQARPGSYAAPVSLLIVMMWLVPACSQAPTAPTASPPSTSPPAVTLTGLWRGQYLETSCISTTCPVCCTSRGKVERRRDVVLQVTQDGAMVAGLWNEAPLEFQDTLGGLFSGVVSDTTLSLKGLLFSVPATSKTYPEEPTSMRIADFAATTGATADSLSGAFWLVTTDVMNRELMRVRNEFVRLTRVP